MTEISPTVIWACLGIALIVLEIFTSTFFLLFFGIAALVVAVVKLLGLENLPIELIVFALTGMAGILIFRKKILRSITSRKDFETDKNKSVTITEDIPAQGKGSIVYRGSPWQAINDTDVDFNKGDVVTIARVDGIKLILTK